MLIADVARGDGADNSAFAVFNVSRGMRQDAEYQGKITPDLFANLLNEVGREYGDCLLAVEYNSGQAVTDKLIEAEYPNLYWATKGTHEYVEAYLAVTMSNTLPGFTTSRMTRPLIIGKFEEFVRNELITVRSARLIKELETFIWNNGRPEAMRGYNDDLVLVCSIGSFIADTALEIGKKDLEYRRAFLDMGGIVRVGSTLDTTIPGMRGFDPRTNKLASSLDVNQQAYKWLYKG